MKKGFTLIEVLVAVLILTIVVGAAVLVENQSLKSGSIGKNKMTAGGLAQEAVEMVKAKRDQNLLSNVDATAGLDTGYYYLTYSVDTKQPSFTSCGDTLDECKQNASAKKTVNNKEFIQIIEIQ